MRELIRHAATELLHYLQLWLGEPLNGESPVYRAKVRLQKAFGGRLPDRARQLWGRIESEPAAAAEAKAEFCEWLAGLEGVEVDTPNVERVREALADDDGDDAEAGDDEEEEDIGGESYA